MNFIAKFWNEKPILFLIVVAIIILVLYLWISGLIKKSKAAQNYNAAVNQSQTALTQLAAAGVKPSYAQAEYISMANALSTTFTGCGIDWTGVVVPTFQKMKNDADVYALIQNYGVREFDECGWGSFNGDLAAALTYKTGGLILTFSINPFTDASVSSINKILKQNGLTFQF